MTFSQRNPKWSGQKLGKKGLITIGGFGCTTCCLAEVNNEFGANCTPDQVAAHHEWYTPEGLVLWQNLKLKHAIFLTRGYGFNKSIIKEHIKNPDLAVILEVKLGAGKHWLKAESINFLGQIWAKDPLRGDECDVVKRYGAITGYATFKRRTPPLK